MSSVEWIASLLGIACIALGAVRSIWTFPTAIGSVLLVGWVVWTQRLFSDALLQLFFVAANLYGWRNWSRVQGGTGTLAVGWMSGPARLAWLAGGAVAAIVWGTLMHRIGAALAWWDAGIAVASIVAQVLMGRRRVENWWLWVAVDLASVPLYLAKGLWLFAGLYLVYLVLAVWGWRDWRRVGRLQPVAA